MKRNLKSPDFWLSRRPCGPHAGHEAATDHFQHGPPKLWPSGLRAVAGCAPVFRARIPPVPSARALHLLPGMHPCHTEFHVTEEETGLPRQNDFVWSPGGDLSPQSPAKALLTKQIWRGGGGGSGKRPTRPTHLQAPAGLVGGEHVGLTLAGPRSRNYCQPCLEEMGE